MKPKLSHWLRVSLLLLVAALAGCDSGNPKADQVASRDEAAPFEQRFPIQLGDQTINVQLAISPREGQQGLMYRESLDENEGMIFLYQAPQPMSFWMQNVPINLSIGFFDPQGRLKEVYTMFAYNTQSIKSRSSNLQFAIEMRDGWYRDHNIAAGTQLDMEQLKAAMRARGADPADYGWVEE
ncbi:MAG: DUF192 domain-containing protein [Verrucomicrobiota bacterium JB022]|nr:DUF192 domain-containing protein [Verrucomicrobiota bacterium JB022]